MKFDLRNFDSAFYPSTEAFTVYQFNSTELEQTTKFTFSLFTYSNFYKAFVQNKRAEEIRNTVEKYILAKRTDTTEVLKNNQFFEKTFELLQIGSAEALATNSTNLSLALAVLHLEYIECDEHIKSEKKCIEETKPFCSIPDKANSITLLLNDVSDKLVSSGNYEESSFYYDHSARLGLLIENLQQLQTSLNENAELANSRESIEYYEKKKTELLNQIQELEQKQKVA